MRFKAHKKKVHNQVSHQIQWPKNGIDIHYDKTKVSMNNSSFSNIFYDICDEDNKMVTQI